jgi:hypothetical protein
MRVALTLVAALVIGASAAGKEPTRANYHVVIDANDCGEMIHAPLRLPLTLGKPVGSKIDGASGSALALETTLLADGKVRIRGTFFAKCATISPDFTVPLGQTVTYKNGKASLSITAGS